MSSLALAAWADTVLATALVLVALVWAQMVPVLDYM
jgi:hypothetical protein